MDKIIVPLPDGRQLVAYDKQDPNYPGIKIDLIDSDGSEDSIAWVEYNTQRSDYAPEQKLRLLLWNAADDEPAVNMAYDTGEFEED